MIVSPIRRAAGAPLGFSPSARPCGDSADLDLADRESVLIAVGKALVRQGLLRIMEGAALGERVVVVPDGTQARRLLRSKQFDLVLIDPGQVAAAGEDELRSGSRRVLLVTDRDHVGEAPLPGAGLACGMLSESLDDVATRQLLKTVTECRRPRFEPEQCVSCTARATWATPELPLSPRELEVFCAIGSGTGPQGIARELGVSVKTVESHREKIKQKLGLEGADALVCAATRWCQGYRIG